MSAAALIVGASRGIGLELVRQYRAAGRPVLATCRSDEAEARLRDLGATVYRLDVTDAAALPGLIAAAGAAEVRTVFLAAGILPVEDRTLDPALMDEAMFLEVMRVNVLAPMRLAFGLVRGLREGSRLAVLSSTMGSMTHAAGTSCMAYRTAKAAVNMVAKAAALEGQGRGVTVLSFHPGWVQTDMGGAAAPVTVDESVRGLIGVTEAATPAMSGKFWNYTGEELSW